MRLRRCLLGKLAVGHTIRSSALCFKRLANKNKLFSSQLNTTNCLWLENKVILLFYFIICMCELEVMKEQAADSCFPVARPAAAAAWIGIRYQLSFIIVISRCHVCHCLTCVEMPLWKKKRFSSVTEKQSCLSDWNKESSLDPRLLFLGFVLWNLNDLSAAPFWSSSRFVFFPARWKSDSVIVFIPWPTGREM